jgi:hypothetical protein
MLNDHIVRLQPTHTLTKGGTALETQALNQMPVVIQFRHNFSVDTRRKIR